MKALIARKVGMTNTINENGAVEAITLLSVEANYVTQVKDTEKDGYIAYQIGTIEDKRISKPEKGHLKKSGKELKVTKEIRQDELNSELKVGDELNVEVFEVGDKITVTANSKGKGFAGTIKRHNFHRQRKTHGGKGNTRKPGSIGSMYPQHIMKGKKMSGQMGAEKVTIKGQKIAIIDTDLMIIGITGAVPGPRKGLVLVKGAKS